MSTNIHDYNHIYYVLCVCIVMREIHACALLPQRGALDPQGVPDIIDVELQEAGARHS